MTTAASIITAAYRENQITRIVSSPTTTEQNEALDRLNAILATVIGNQVGQELSPLNIGGSYDQSAYCATWVPQNARLVLNLAGSQTYKLSPEPYEGQRLAVIDAGGNLASYNLTLDGNGRTIEGAASIVLNTNGVQRQWLYRDDTANWVKLTDLALTDTMPFPEEFDDYFITRLAMRINPRNGVATGQETAAALQLAERQIRARYRKPRPRQDMPHGFIGEHRHGYGLTPSDFIAGRTWR